jgi:hypothetical protein
MLKVYVPKVYCYQYQCDCNSSHILEVYTCDRCNKTFCINHIYEVEDERQLCSNCLGYESYIRGLA